MDIALIVIALVLFSVLAFQRISAIILGPLVSLFVVIFSGLPIFETMAGPYMESAATYVKNYFLMFFVGALFGAIYEQTRAAESIAEALVRLTKGKFAAAVIMTITGILTCGGISGFVIFFAMYPIALRLFKSTNLTRRLIPAAISAGTWTWSMSGIGTPAIQNVIPTRYFDTTPRAAFIPGLAAMIFQFVVIFIWLEYRSRALTAKGYEFNDSRLTPLPADALTEAADKSHLPNPWVALIPPAVILFLFNFIKLAPLEEGGKVRNFPVEGAVLAGIILATIFFWKRIPNLRGWIEVFNKGAGNSTTAILNTAIVVGFAGAVRVTSGFTRLIENLKGLNMSPLWFVAITVAVAAGAAGSASGGMGIAFDALKDTYASMNINPEYIHRIAAIASGTLDTLPHQGAQITLLTLCSLTHKEAYFDIAVTQIAIPVLALFVAIPMMSMGL